MRFPIAEQFGAVVSYESSNTFTRRPNGGASINVFHRSILATYDLSAVNFKDSVAETLLDFQRSLLGQSGVFGYRDPLDHRCDFGRPSQYPEKLTYTLNPSKQYRVETISSFIAYGSLLQKGETNSVFSNAVSISQIQFYGFGYGFIRTNSDGTQSLIYMHTVPNLASHGVEVSLFRVTETSTLLEIEPNPISNADLPYKTGSRSSELGILLPNPDGVRTTFQLYKRYRIVTERDSSANNPTHLINHDRYRPITRPIANTITLYENGIAKEGAINEDGGDVVFSTPPANNALLTWSGEFDTPVRFESAKNIALETVVYDKETDTVIYNLPNLKLKEVKERTGLELLESELETPPITPFQEPNDFNSSNFVDHLMEIDLSYGSIAQPIFQSIDTDLDSGYTYRDQQGTRSTTQLAINPQIFLYYDQARYLAGLYRICYGNAIAFRINDYNGLSKIPNRLSANEILDQMYVRFMGSLSIEILRDDEDAKESLYRPSSLSLEQSILSPTESSSYHLFGTYYAKAPRRGDSGLECNIILYWRTIDPIVSRNQDGSISSSDIYVSNTGGSWHFRWKSSEGDVVGSPCWHLKYYWDARSLLPALSEPGFYSGSNIGTITALAYYPANGTCYASHQGTSGITGLPISSAGSGGGDNVAVVDIIPVNPSEFEAQQEIFHLGNRLSSIACYWCHGWLITFADEDNEKLGFTDHDRHFTLNNVKYSSLSGFRADAIAQDSSTQEIRSELTSVLNSELITEEDLLSERYERATLEMFIYDWSSNQKIRTLFTGSFGDMSTEHGINGVTRFILQARSDRYKLSQKTTKVTTQTCRLKFGETGLGKCNFDLSSVTTNSEVLTVNIDATFTANTNRPSGFFNKGIIRFTSGKLKNLAREVLTHNGDTFTFANPFPLLPEVGDEFTAIAGCDRTESACKAYSNFINFGGQPFIPGNDQLMINGQVVTEED